MQGALVDLNIDWPGLYAAGGPAAILIVAVAIAGIIFAARFDWSRSRTEAKDEEKPVLAALAKVNDRLDALTLVSERRLTASETRLDEHQRHLERLEKRLE